ncbi:DUF5133 domain-containing protein [Streptomyces capparidis]
MLMAKPAVLRNLVERYEALAVLRARGEDDVEARQRMQDVAYTLCVTTGTRDVESALAVARRRLGAAPLGEETASSA